MQPDIFSRSLPISARRAVERHAGDMANPGQVEVGRQRLQTGQKVRLRGESGKQPQLCRQGGPRADDKWR